MGVHPHHPTTIPCRRGRRCSQGRHAPHEVWSSGILARIVRDHNTPPQSHAGEGDGAPREGTRHTRPGPRHPCPHCPCVAHCAPQPWVHGSRKVHIDAPSRELAAALDVSNKRCTSGQGCPRTTMALPERDATPRCNSRLPSQPEL